MIRLSVKLRNGGRQIETLSASGHAGMMRESGDPVCAAVSVLIRTLVLFLKTRPEFESDIRIPERGHVFLSVGTVPAESGDCWESICEFFLLGLRSIENDYPEAFNLRYL